MQEPPLTERYQIVFAPTLPAFYEASTTLRRLLDVKGLDAKPRADVELAFEEVAVNVVKHGSAAHDIDVQISFQPDRVILTFEDDGLPFNPLLHQDPHVPESLDEAEIGGLGVMLVKQVTSRIEYERTPHEHNRLTLEIPVR